MKQTLLAIAVALIAFVACESKPKAPEAYDEVTKKIETYYNSKEFGKIYDLYADTMKQAMPLENSIKLFGELYNQTGPIEKMTFSGINFGQALYETKMRKGTLNTTITLDEQHKITGLWFRP